MCAALHPSPGCRRTYQGLELPDHMPSSIADLVGHAPAQKSAESARCYQTWLVAPQRSAESRARASLIRSAIIHYNIVELQSSHALQISLDVCQAARSLGLQGGTSQGCHSASAVEVQYGLMHLPSTLQYAALHPSPGCRRRREQVVASTAMQHHDQRFWKVGAAPAPNDIIWPNLMCACSIDQHLACATHLASS